MKSIIFAIIFCVIFSTTTAQHYMMERQQSLPAMIYPVKQFEAHFSGPAIAEAVMRYWELSPMRFGIKTEDGFQRFLARDDFMMSDTNMGTMPDDWIRSVNHIASSFNLNYGRQYSRIELVPGYSNTQEFYEIISRSVAKNVPVAIAFSARVQDSSITYAVRHNFILVTAVSGMPETAMYTYLDPSDGILRQFDNNFLPFISSGDVNEPDFIPSYVIAYLDSSDRNFLTSIDANAQEQASEKCSFLTLLTSVCSNLGRGKRAIYRPSTCVAVDTRNPLSNYADFIYVQHKLLGHNGIQVKLSRPTAMTMERVFMENDRVTFLGYVEALLMRIVQKGTVMDNDRVHAAKVIYDGMPYVHEKTLTLLREEDLRPIFIQTYRAYNFQETVKSIGVDNTVYISDTPK